MITYEVFLKELSAAAEEEYRVFQSRLLKNDAIELLGVRMPVLRRIAKKYRAETETVLAFPDRYYETAIVKCTLIGMLPYAEFVKKVDYAIGLLDNWAVCDSFRAPCIRSHRAEFLPVIERYLRDEREYAVRYALVTLLSDYMEKAYLPFVFRALRECRREEYYVVMAAAWLLAEVLVRYYTDGAEFLRENTISAAVRRKAIQKARESFRLSAEQKDALKMFKQ